LRVACGGRAWEHLRLACGRGWWVCGRGWVWEHLRLACGRGWWVCGRGWGWEHLRLACGGGGGMGLAREGRWGLVAHKQRALTPQFFAAFDGQKIA